MTVVTMYLPASNYSTFVGRQLRSEFFYVPNIWLVPCFLFNFQSLTNIFFAFIRYRSDVGSLSPYGDRKDSLELEGVLGKRARTSPPLSERVMLYVRQDTDDVYTPLHVAPPTTQGLLHAVSSLHNTPWLATLLKNGNLESNVAGKSNANSWHLKQH